MHSEEQAKKVPKIFPTNEIARNKICSVDLLNGARVEENWIHVSSRINLNFVNKYLLFVRIKLDKNEGKSFLRRGQANVRSFLKLARYGKISSRSEDSLFVF